MFLNRKCLMLAGVALIAVCSNVEAASNPGKAAIAILSQRCAGCHGDGDVSADIDFRAIRTPRQLRANPELLTKVINAVSDRAMPPEDGGEIDSQERELLVGSLKQVLRQVDFEKMLAEGGVMRLNRFQYNNTVRDLFGLKLNVFALPEKLMTRHGDYLSGESHALPTQVKVESRALRPEAGMTNVRPFPKDSRASHGFDNQADVLTMSPLLLDAFFRLSVSIIESPDFTEEKVEVWDSLFSETMTEETTTLELQARIRPFLLKAFRRPVDTDTLTRYVTYAEGHLQAGLDLTQSMKKVVSAVLSSPRFFYRTWAKESGERSYEVASSLAYTLWGSCPDQELLQLAQTKQLLEPLVLRETIQRMMIDPKIERFMDSFPVQWMQLETLMAVTPDPKIDRYFSLDGQYPATVQMVLEPLLLFDALYVENRPVKELLAPEFNYRSAFLQRWYEDRMSPPPVNEVAITQENEIRSRDIKTQQAVVDELKRNLDRVAAAVIDPIVANAIEVDLAAGQAKWELAQREQVDEMVEMSAWHQLGPFAGGSLDEAHKTAFIDESAVDLSKQYGELKWVLKNEFVDGKVHPLKHAKCANYLYRTVTTKTARSLEVSIGSDDSFKLWLNGQLVGEHNMVRGVEPDQNKLRLELAEGKNEILFKVSNGDGGYGFYFKAVETELPEAVLSALEIDSELRDEKQIVVLAKHYLAIAPELKEIRIKLKAQRASLIQQVQQAQDALNGLPKPKSIAQHREDAQRGFDQQVRSQLRLHEFSRVAAEDPRYGGVITNAAVLSMTSGPERTHPVARGVWVAEVIFNDPPSPPPNDIPPLNEDAGPKDLTIRERFAAHRDNPSCAGCHAKLDPLGFALENYDITGRWRDDYDNGRKVDPTGTLMLTHKFDDVVQFKNSLMTESDRFTEAFVTHLLRFAMSRELGAGDSIVVDEILEQTAGEGHLLRAVIEEVVYRSIR